MGLKIFTAKQIQTAWGLSSDTQATQAFDPWAEKTARLANRYPAQFLALVALLMQEREAAEEIQFAAELPAREAQVSGRADRPAHQRIGSPR